MAPKRGRPAKKATKNVTNPELNQVQPVNVESNPDPRVNSETNRAPLVNVETNTVPLMAASGAELNEAMIARIVNEQLVAVIPGMLAQYQQNIASSSRGSHIERNITDRNTETYTTTSMNITVLDSPPHGSAAKITTLEHTIILANRYTDEAIRNGTLTMIDEESSSGTKIKAPSNTRGTKRKRFQKNKTKAPAETSRSKQTVKSMVRLFQKGKDILGRRPNVISVLIITKDYVLNVQTVIESDTTPNTVTFLLVNPTKNHNKLLKQTERVSGVEVPTIL
ncbi:hypothetical protein E3N88_26122 [Mikania micrantha]|uniref:Uncharacterized protein n=1 Tax=Mikania micrantha TaxID=192012 RepID=A0A5N6N8F8_9ASTR|nr:hypothetical protein E3N88_26122 [Mikania micrantha]